ncbi:hypothetical protein B0H13DRAFT_2321539 [Mycena leptocephala]|nr:hypothetical protein B0H13DRAFT_2321539 [Mycena leptocephala]
MVGQEWTTTPQCDFMLAQLSAYQATLWRDWFQLWPEELTLGLLLHVPGVPGATPLIAKELDLLGAKIKAKVLKRGYGKLNEEAEVGRVAAAGPSEGEVTILTEEERKWVEIAEDELVLARVRKNHALRLSMWRTTAIKMYELESDDIKSEVEAATLKFNKDNRTPIEYQHGIDQLGHVLAKVNEAVMKETGWVGFAMVGGPMPRRGGVISTKIFCFGTMPAGLDFQAVHPTFEDNLSLGDEEAAIPEGLLPFDESDVEDSQHVADDEMDPNAAAAKTVHTAPKRIRHKTRQSTHFPDLPVADAPVPDTPIAPALVSSPHGLDTAATDLDTMSFSFTSLPEFNPLSLSYSEDWDASHYGLGNFNAMLGDMSDTASSSSFSLRTEENVFSMAEVPTPATRPAPRPIFHGASFEKDCEVGGSPGWQPTVVVNGFNFPRPSALLQAFTSLSSLSPRFTFGAAISTLFTFTPSTAADTLHLLTSRLCEAPVTVANGTPQLTPPTHVKTTAHAPCPPIVAHPPTLPVVKTVIANATAEVEQRCPATSPAPAVSLPLAQSRPSGNAPKGHPLAATTKKAVAPKKASKPCNTPAPAATSESMPMPVVAAPVRGCGRPCKNITAPVSENVQPVAMPDAVPALAMLMGAAAHTEAACIRRKDTANCKLRADVLQQEKAADANREHARLHNPAGGADLFITGSRPKRAVTVMKNPNGSSHVKKPLPTQLAADKDQRMLDGFAEQKRKAVEDLPGSGVPKKGKPTAAVGKRKAVEPAASALPLKKARVCK